MGNYTILYMFENPRRGRQATNFTKNDPKILDLKSTSEQIIFRKLSLGAPGESWLYLNKKGQTTRTLSRTIAIHFPSPYPILICDV